MKCRSLKTCTQAKIATGRHEQSHSVYLDVSSLERHDWCVLGAEMMLTWSSCWRRREKFFRRERSAMHKEDEAVQDETPRSSEGDVPLGDTDDSDCDK